MARDKGTIFLALIEDEAGLRQETVYLDATLSDRRELGVEWTSHPREEGAPATDHKIVQRKGYTLTGIITATPLDAVLFDENRIANTIDKLEEFARKGYELVIVSGLDMLPNMGISNLAISRNGPAQEVEVKMDLVELIKVRTVTVAIPPEILAQFVEPGASDQVDGGDQTGTELGDEFGAVWEGDQSALAAASDATGLSEVFGLGPQ